MLIDAAEAVKIIKRYDDRGLTLDEVTRITDGIAREIEAMPTVDAVEVVRCEDCKHWHTDEVFKTSSCRISHDEKGFEKQTDADFFCGHGVRNDDDWIMADLIDREELKKSILKWLPSEDYDPERSGLRFDEDLVVSLMMEIEEQPTIDAVPVVRCEKCIHHKGLNAMEKFEYGSNVVWCNIPHFGGVLMKNDDFCSYGERGDGE